MKLLTDTNVVLDYMLQRQPNYEHCRKIISRAIDNDDYEIISASAITDIFYIAKRQGRDSYDVQDAITDLLELVHIATVTEDNIRTALNLRWNDFEDAVQYAVAIDNGADFIITNNKKDFDGAQIPVLTPKEFLESQES